MNILWHSFCQLCVVMSGW